MALLVVPPQSQRRSKGTGTPIAGQVMAICLVYFEISYIITDDGTFRAFEGKFVLGVALEFNKTLEPLLAPVAREDMH
jgi:hypothetical protein